MTNNNKQYHRNQVPNLKDIEEIITGKEIEEFTKEKGKESISN